MYTGQIWDKHEYSKEVLPSRDVEFKGAAQINNIGNINNFIKYKKVKIIYFYKIRYILSEYT